MQRCLDVFHCYMVLTDAGSANPSVVDKILADQAERAGWKAPDFVEQTGPTRHLHAEDMRMRVTCAPGPDGRAEMHLAISGEGDATPMDLQIRLAATCHSLLDQLDVSELRWLDGDQAISPQDFRDLLAPATAPAADTGSRRHRVKAKRPLRPTLRRRARPEAPSTSDAAASTRIVARTRSSLLSRQEKLLRDALRLELSPAALLEEFGPQRDSDPLRLSAWLLTFVVALLALPVAIVLALVNLMRGENFRLTTQMLVFAALLTNPHVAAALSLDEPNVTISKIVVALEQAVPVFSNII